MNSTEGDPEHIDSAPLHAQSTQHRRGYADLGYPWAAPDVPHARDVEASARAWVVAQGLLAPAQLAARFDPVNVGLLTALCYPGASRERQELIAQLLAWIFIQDDVFDDAVAAHDPVRVRAVLEGYALTLRTGETQESAASRALAELRTRIVAIADPVWFDWFCESMRGFWIDGIVEETRIRSEERTPARTDYVRMRTQSIGVLPFLDLVELSLDFAIPRVVCADPALMSMRVRTARIIAYANDVFSYEKERRAGDPNNLVHVLMHHDHATFPDAVDRVVRLHDREVALFEHEARTLPFIGTIPHVDAFIEGHRAWMRGALDWQLASRRYVSGRKLIDETVQ